MESAFCEQGMERLWFPFLANLDPVPPARVANCLAGRHSWSEDESHCVDFQI